MNDATSNYDPQAEPTVEQLTREQSVINRSAVKAYALKVSKERRAGKFTRVSEDFLNAVEARVESTIRGVVAEPVFGSNLPQGDDRELITGAALDRIREKLNVRAKQIVVGLVIRHPTLGCTLKD